MSEGKKSPAHDVQTPAVKFGYSGRLVRALGREFPARSDYKIIYQVRHKFARLSNVIVAALVFAPAIACALYFSIIVTPRYLVEAKFVVRTAAKASAFSGLTSILQMTGLARSQDDVFSVQDFMVSRDAVAQMKARIPLEQVYSHNGADFVARYPSFIYGNSQEEFFKYFQWMINVSYSATTGVSTLRVQAFKASDAQLIADTLLTLSEELVNRLNERIRNDAVKVSELQVQADEHRLTSAQLALTDFRNRELIIDPDKSSLVLSEVLKRLSSNLATTETDMREIRGSSPASPQLSTLQQRATALSTLIAQERKRISNEEDGLASKIGEFERLTLERDYAKQSLTASATSLEAARAEARRKQLYLERITEPNLPDTPTMPQSLRWIATVFGANFFGLLVVWLFVTGLREHVGR